MEIRDYEYVLIPNILSKYKCSSSGECCQSKWKIDIDKKAYETTKVQLEQLNEDIETYITKNDEGTYVTKFANGYCKLITDEKLCRVHKEFGWQCLSDTCKTYPRHLKLTSRGVEVGITFSCPSAAKLLLSDEEFEILKLKKEDFFFMKPSNMSFMIPENNLKTELSYRYYEMEEMIINILKNPEISGKKINYIIDTLKDLQKKNIQEIDFKKYEKEFLNSKDEVLKGTNIEILLEKILMCKRDRAKTVSSEFLNLFKIIKLKSNLEEDRKILRKENYFLTEADLNELKTSWTKKEERVLNNYLMCLIFSKDLYYSIDYALFKIVLLGSLLKLRLLLNRGYVGRDLTDEEIINAIKHHDNDFAHDGEFFRELYVKKDLGVSIQELTLKVLSILY